MQSCKNICKTDYETMGRSGNTDKAWAVCNVCDVRINVSVKWCPCCHARLSYTGMRRKIDQTQ